MKYFDITENVAIDTAGAVECLNDMQNGTSAITRLGNQIKIWSFEIKATSKVTDTTGVAQTHRYCLVLDKQPNGVLADHDDVWVDGLVMGLRNLDNRKRFKILMDKIVNLSAWGQSGALITWSKYIPFKKPILVEYNSTNGGDIGDIITNALLFFSLGNYSATFSGNLTARIRIRYTDG